MTKPMTVAHLAEQLRQHIGRGGGDDEVFVVLDLDQLSEPARAQLEGYDWSLVGISAPSAANRFVVLDARCLW